MLQPFEPMRAVYVERMIAMKKVYLISQSYKRGENTLEEQSKIGLLFTDYDDPGLAKLHLNVLADDPYAAMLDLRTAAHKEKLLSLLSPTSPYYPYWSVVRSTQALKDHVDKNFKDKIRRYVAEKTDWKPSRSDSLRTKIESIFGELYIILVHKKEKLRITFEELEKM